MMSWLGGRGMRTFEEFLPRWAEVSTPAFWASTDGVEFLAIVRESFGVKVAAAVCRDAGWQVVTADDVVSIAVMTLLDVSSGWSRVAAADNPAGYFWQCLMRATRAAAGTFGDHLRDGVELSSDVRTDAPAEIVAVGLLVATPARDVVSVPTDGTNDLTDLGAACRSSAATLESFTPSALHLHLRPLVDWFALNPPAHRGHGHTDAARCGELRQFGVTAKQAMALAKICWGTRGRERDTSLLAWWLLHPETNPLVSQTHRVALRQFAHEMTVPQRTVRRRRSLV